MDGFLRQPDRLRFLVCSDVDIISAGKLSEKFVPQPPYYDGIIAVGPFYQDEIEKKEDEAVALGDIASVIAQLENIVCRVIYLPTEKDPVPMIVSQMNLTPNSIGIHGRRLNLTPELFIMGFTEKSELGQGTGPIVPENPSYEDIENVELVSGVSVGVIKEMLDKRTEDGAEEPKKGDQSDETKNDTGIFVLNYRYAHTLNQFLFHMTDDLDQAGIDLVVIASPTTSSELTRLPKKFGRLSIVAPKSLRRGFYSTVELARNEAGAWSTALIEHHQL
jgi:hypothetical protein